MQPTLKFNVRNQNISRVDNFLPVRNSRNYLYAEFNFLTEDWNSEETKTAIFKSDGIEPIPVVLGETDTCLVPWEVLEKTSFVVSVYAGNLITADSAQVKLYKSGYRSGDVADPTPTVYEQVMSAFDETKTYTAEQAELAKRYAVGSFYHPESSQDNAMYYAGKAQEFSESAADSLAETQRLAEETDANAKQAARDKSDTARYMNAAAQSETNAAASALAAQTAQEAAETAQKSAGNSASIAESAAGRAELAEDSAAGAANNAAESAESASLSAQNAENSAEEAAQSAADALTQIEAEKTAAIKSVNDSGNIQTAAVNTAGEAQASAVNLAGQAQVEAVEQEGAEQVAMIQATAGEYITYESAEALAIKSHAEGSAILARDSAVWRVPGMRIYGKSTQKTTTGAQLLNFPDVEEIKINGITWSCKNGIVTTKGTATDYSPTNGIISNNIKGMTGTYYVSGDAGGAIVYVRVDRGDVATYYHNKSFSLDGTEDRAFVNCQVDPDVTVDTILYPMLNIGDTPLPWEPYTGGIPSPNIDYPQDIVSLAQDSGAIGVSVGGGNLINASTYYISSYFYGIAQLMTENGELIKPEFPVDTTNNTTIGIAYVIPCQKGIKYYIDKITSVTNFGVGISEYENLKDATSHKNAIGFIPSGVDASVARTYTAKGNGILLINLSSVYNSDNSTNIGQITGDEPIMVSISPDINYEPCKPIQTASFLCPNGLPGLNISSNPGAEEGLYTDDEGKLYVADYVDFKTGEYVKCINIVKISSFSLLSAYGDGNYIRFSYLQTDADFAIEKDKGSKCTHFKMIFSFTEESEHFYASGNYIQVFTDKFSTLEEANAWLQENEVYVAYVLATPIRTPLTEQEIAAYKALRTYSPSTTITNDAGAHMEADYITDPETYISNNYTPKSAYDTLEQRVLALETNLIGG